MVFGDRDLRRRAPAREPATPISSMRVEDYNFVHARRKRGASSGPDRGTLAFAAIIFAFGLIKHRLALHLSKESPRFKRWRARERKDTHVRDEDRRGDASTGDWRYRPKFGASELGYDIYDCPRAIPPGYPRTWEATELLTNWNPNDVEATIPRQVYQGLCTFDYQTQYDVAKIYRDADQPFIIQNDPKVLSVVDRWSDPDHLLENLSGQMIYTERSPTNHFKFYREDPDNDVERWTKPANDIVMMSYAEWHELALRREATVLQSQEMEDRVKVLRKERISNERTDGERVLPEDDVVQVEEDLDTEQEKRMKWYYLRLNGWVEDASDRRNDKFMFDELSFFDPRSGTDSDFYLMPAKEQNGINCRFGMRGIVAEAHYDDVRNMLALLEGGRRYILSHPSQCGKLALHPYGHPSARQSFDWSNPAMWDLHPEFRGARLTEVVMRAGDVLFLPTSWFHYIVNLSKNVQCNSMSGRNPENDHYIADCGFD